MPTTYLLSVEIKTLEPQPDQLDAPSNLVIFCDSQDDCCIAQGLNEIKTAIIGTIPQIGTNSRHTLLFNVQIEHGDHIDALIASIEHKTPQPPEHRLRQTGNN
ncbi:hypothetical protein C7B62_15590 [Pleurocapsa sp. CCALA 161]|uniref:hypothetical protein n=1 Tax=Pleurocapsa sp. CCALA 161 TaxID=2107688 RepID=UPI000D080417|nr:hypothetical protein [Pleurocapsa sp. CCALA 161]PSB08783.1 hypothetical protein C7B62_15590 [Pleurocapsa sp. CCALA 161]